MVAPWIAGLFSSGIFNSVGEYIGGLFGGDDSLTEVEAALQKAALEAEAKRKNLETILIVGGIGAGVLVLALLFMGKKK